MTVRAHSNCNKHIVIVVTEDWYFLSHRLHLALAARAQGYRVTIVTGRGQRSEDIRRTGLEHVTFSLDRRSTGIARELTAVNELTRLFRALAPDLVHLVAAKPIVYGNLAAALAGRPPVVTAVAGMGYLFLGGGTRRRAMRGLYEIVFRTLVKRRRRARVLVQNSDDATFFVDRGLARPDQIVRVVGSGVDTARFAQTPEPPFPPIVVLMHSRMLWDKGVRELADAARILRAQSAPPFIVRLVGEPDAANPAAIPIDILRRWSADGLVEWVGRSNKIPEELQRCHIACLPSYREGAPLSLIEACAAGRPVVTTDVPGCREVVRHGDNGLLVPVRDAAALANSLLHLMQNPALRTSMGRRGRTRAELEFGDGVITSKILAMYDELISREGHT